MRPCSLPPAPGARSALLSRSLAAMLAALLLAGCVQQTEQASGTPPAAPSGAGGGGGKPAGERLKIAVVPKGTTHQFWQTIRAGAEAAGAEPEINAEILWNGPKAETDVRDQIDIVQSFASQGVDGIALAATNKQSLSPVVQELEGKGIPVVTIDSGIEPDTSRSFIATDNVAAARLAAAELGRLLGGKGKVAVLSFLKGAGTSDEREQGFLEGIREFPGITVLPVEYTDSDANKARDKMETLLTQHRDVAGVFASNEPNVKGAASVLADRGLAGKVKLVGFDASDAEITYLKEGVVQALVVQDPYRMGYEGVKALAAIARGGASPPKRVDTGATVVTRENMEKPEVRKLLYPLEK
jgi:ribose transport system substrate-binding protein